jgi:peroxiredoxin
MRRDRIKISLFFLLGVSVVINIIQGTRLLRLSDADAEQASRGEPHSGMVMPDLEVKDLSGRKVVLDYRATTKSTVLYVFTPSCSWCALNSENLSSLAKQIPVDYRLIGVSLSGDGLENYMKAHSISFPVYRDPSPDGIARVTGLVRRPRL